MLAPANKMSSERIKPFPACLGAKKLAIAFKADVVVIDIVAVIDIETVTAIMTFLAIKTIINFSKIEPGIKCKEFIPRWLLLSQLRMQGLSKLSLVI